MSDDRHEAVSRRAYELWEKEGGEHGRHEDHWHQASQELGDDVSGGGEGGATAAPDGTTLEAAPAKPAASTKPRAKAASGGAEASPAAAAPARPIAAAAAKPRKTKPAK